MKVYMDDLRDTPGEYDTRTYTAEATINLLHTRQVEALSLDNDLGDGLTEGYKVLDELERLVYDDPTFPIPEITIHSSNASRVEYMQRALKSIQRIRQQQVGGQ
jgi:hypothetical protein